MVGPARARRVALGLALLLVGCAGPERRGARAPLVVATAAPEGAPDGEPDVPEPAPLASASNDDLGGRWEGVGVQSDGPSWRMQLELTGGSSGRCGHVEYPTLPCAADWICTGRDADGTVHAREELTAGQDRCIDRGAMTLKATPGGAIEWHWEGSGVSANATLKRP